MKPFVKKPTSKVRIIGGFWRSRLIQVADQPGLRPTTDRVRETLFNWLGQNLEGLTCLDMFAGTGALGFESASRGAKQVVLIESSPVAHQMLVNNLQSLLPGPEHSKVEIIRSQAINWLKQHSELKFDIVFVDPPFADEKLLKDALLMAKEAVISAKSAVIYVECASEISNDVLLEHLPGWQINRQMVAGAAKATLFERV